MKRESENSEKKDRFLDEVLPEIVKELPPKKDERAPYHLVVKSMFGKYKRGDRITHANQVNKILGTAHESMVLKVVNHASN